MKVAWKKYKLELNQPFVLSYGAFDFRWSYIFQLTEGNHSGLGEATAITYYGWSEEKIESEFIRFEKELNKGVPFEEALAVLEFLPPVRNAIQCAWVDLQSRKNNQTLARYYNLPMANSLPISSITITGNNYNELTDQINQYDWPVYKIKMGTEEDEIKFDIIRSHPNKRFRIDANTGWSLEWIHQHVNDLQLNNLELIEQPFEIEHSALNLELKKLVNRPIIADEACRSVDDVRVCAEYFDGINVKLMKCGGWDRTMEIIKAARANELLVMIGCMTESSIGISHAAQLLSLVDIADIDGSHLIANDPAQGTYLETGNVILSDDTGSGARLKDNL